MKIGLVPGSFKPYHAGHDALVRYAAEDGNDVVIVFYSTATSKKSSRGGLTGEDASKIITNYVMKTMPSNVKMIPADIPVSAVWDELQKAEKLNSKNVYTIYSDDVDIQKYNEKSFMRWTPNLYKRGQIVTRGLRRGVDTPDISGTLMRQYIAVGDFENFAKMLPPSIKKYSKNIIDLISAKNESLLRSYIKELIQS